ncbi:MAG: luciferase family protein [Polyangiaceae bacterium]
MKLAEKGRDAPPPPLPPAAERVCEAIAHWPGVHARTHWRLGDDRVADGADFYLGQEELGHIHLESEAHVALGSALAGSVIKAGLARRFPWSREFAVFQIADRAAEAHALWLFELSYERRRGLAPAELSARIREYVERAASGPLRTRA